MNPLAEDLEFVLTHTRELWEEMRGQKMFITGGTGFFGCWLLESFAWANEKLNLQAEALILTRDPKKFAEKCPHLAGKPFLRFTSGDIRDFAFSNEKFAFVIHAATEASVKLNEENPLLMLDTVVAGTRRALDFAVHCGAKKFLLASSGAVYGPQPQDMTHIPEDYRGAPTPLDTRSAYGEGKRMAELLCTIYAKHFGLETKIARCFAFVGPHLPLDTHFAVGNFIRDAMRGQPILINGDGTPERSYLYAADLAVWLWTILFRGPSGRAYNVGSAENKSIRQTAEAVREVTGKALEIRVAKTAVPCQPILRYVPANDLAKKELNLAPRISLNEGIRKTMEWHSQNLKRS